MVVVRGISFILLVSYVSSDGKHVRSIRSISEENRCTLPSQPQNGYWSIANGKGNPGEEVPTSTVLEYKCNENFRLSGHPYVYCSTSGWSSTTTPQCEQLCPPLMSTTKTIIHCYDRNGKEIDCREATDGSFLKYECVPFYEPVPGQRKIIYCTEGLWSSLEPPTCQPICGKKIDAAPLISNGQSLQNLVYPWIVALYHKENNNYVYNCGGTIIHRKVVLTAAHCVTDDYANPHPAEDYEVVAAKLHSNYSDPRDTNAQYLKLSHMVVHSQYKGESKRFLGDIALLITREAFKIGRLVKPVCINDLHTIYLYPGNIGEIAGWGVTETGLPADELKALDIPYKDDMLCDRELPKDWAERYDVIDKMCAGSPEKRVSVCKGDSGSGLVFKNIEDNRYYVHGIVSIAPSNGTGILCNTFTSALYTKVSFYYQFIDSELHKQNQCRLPNYPKNGKWILKKSSQKIPGNIVSPYDVLDVVCENGYKLSVSNSTMDCETLILVKPTCNATDISNQKTDTHKENCGRKFDVPSNNGTPYLDFPWVVHIYENSNHIALGTLISKRMVITVSTSYHPLISAENLTVTTRQYYWLYGETKDEYVQYYNVKRTYQNKKTLGDIAFLLLEDKITQDKWVQPICVKGVNSVILKQGDNLQIIDYNYPRRTTYPKGQHIQNCKISYKSLTYCLEETPYVSYKPDLICGIPLGSSSCSGEVGSGLMYENPVDKQYYLVGLRHSIFSEHNKFFISFMYHYAAIIEEVEKHYKI